MFFAQVISKQIFNTFSFLAILKFMPENEFTQFISLLSLVTIISLIAGAGVDTRFVYLQAKHKVWKKYILDYICIRSFLAIIISFFIATPLLIIQNSLLLRQACFLSLVFCLSSISSTLELYLLTSKKYKLLFNSSFFALIISFSAKLTFLNKLSPYDFTYTFALENLIFFILIFSFIKANKLIHYSKWGYLLRFFTRKSFAILLGEFGIVFFQRSMILSVANFHSEGIIKIVSASQKAIEPCLLASGTYLKTNLSNKFFKESFTKKISLALLFSSLIYSLIFIFISTIFLDLNKSYFIIYLYGLFNLLFLLLIQSQRFKTNYLQNQSKFFLYIFLSFFTYIFSLLIYFLTKNLIFLYLLLPLITLGTILFLSKKRKRYGKHGENKMFGKDKIH
ncbi:hypothetical protein EU95_0560 [Prochlorococcus marinus str. MIT 9201]|uniref:Polysaccharide biosynthesis protein n=1 Tax=Prochlorococcus marinus str. MIT 9201 TaxID=93057 RepID=A0A0A2A4Z7_PROMR|nr:hypothetical protein EU95_0560 [Prochlorococcus marinus str. MIT 9201]